MKFMMQRDFKIRYGSHERKVCMRKVFLGVGVREKRASVSDRASYLSCDCLPGESEGEEVERARGE